MIGATSNTCPGALVGTRATGCLYVYGPRGPVMGTATPNGPRGPLQLALATLTLTR